ncbi:MAG: hypothetical protein II956_16390 [Bacteroidales bacterium]|nr:hypothetical protein [Bacteroidales bacterium]
MKKNYLTKLWFVSMVGLLPLAACQDDDVDAEIRKTESVWVACDEYSDVEQVTLKKNLIRKTDTVYCFDANTLSYSSRYTTIKFYDTKKDIMQEWLLEDWHESGFCDFWYARSNDSDGTKYGYYYPWEGNLTEIDDFDELFVKKKYVNGVVEEIPQTGFHIPTLNDMNELDKLIGGNQVREKLNINFDGTYSPDFNVWTWNYAWFWVDPRDYSHWPENNGIDPGKVEGCGVLAVWYPASAGKGKYRWLTYTNDKHLCANVRFMRTITKAQW